MNKMRWLGAGAVAGSLLFAACDSGNASNSSNDKAGDKVAGEKVYNTKGCNGCHSTDGSQRTGPSFKGIWGTEVELEGGKKVKVDQAYVTRSIKEPGTDVVKGFSPVMPTLQVSDQEIADVSAFIESKKS